MFAQIEMDLLNNMAKSLGSEDWRVDRVRAFQEFKLRNMDILSEYDVNGELSRELQQTYLRAGYQTEQEIRARVRDAQQTGTRFSVDDVKLRTMIRDIQGEFRTAETAALRLMDDIYKKALYQAQLAMATNLYTLDQAIDMGTRDLLAAGVNCVQYANGARVNIVSYAEMALRTGNRRAGLQGQGAMRADWGEYLVYISQYGACSDTCLPWQGRVYFDDVFSGGNATDAGKYPLLSVAIRAGLFHPNCRHRSSTYYEGLSRLPDRMDEAEVRRNATLESQQRYNERNIRKWKRLAEGSLDPDNKAYYQNKARQWQARQRELIGDNSEVLRRDYRRERAF
jgi:hypothetical protein